MKKSVLFALLFSVVAAASARAAHVEPLQNQLYQCYYSNQTMGESDPGFSRFTWNYMNTADQKRGIEVFDVSWGTDNRKVTFAKPVDYPVSPYGPYTVWEFTISPYGPQCKRAAAKYNGLQIELSECSDGHSRVCYAW